MQKFLDKNYQLLIGIILSFVAIVSILNAASDSLIYDEAAHIPAGYSYLTQHDMRLNPEHPPLLKDMAGLPLLFIQPKFDTAQDFWTKDNANDSQWNAGKIFLFASENNPDQIIFWSRLPFVLLSLLLGLFIFKWTRELAGLTAGMLALILYAFDPNILGHNHFVTTDLGIAAFITFCFYYFLKFIKHPTWQNAALFGIFLGLMQLAKFSSVLTFPIFALIIFAYPVIKIHSDKKYARLKSLSEYILKGSAAFIISLIIVYVVYYLNTYAMPQTKLLEIMDHYFNPEDTRAINVFGRRLISWMNAQPILMPLADYVFGVARVFQRVAGGNVTYFIGEVSNKGYLSYFPIVFLIKEPLPILFFIFFSLGLGLLATIKSLTHSSRHFLAGFFRYLRTHVVEFSLLLFILFYAAVSIQGRLNIGFRHLFPILPFIYILTAVTVARFLKNKIYHHKKFASITHNSPEAMTLSQQEAREKQKIKIFSVAFVVLVAYLILGTVFAYPYYMAYFNETVGGAKNGHHYVVDSNADWGQDLKRLVSFLDKHPEIGKIRLDYFGLADPQYYLEDKYLTWWSAKQPEAGWYAISTEFLQQSLFDKTVPDAESYRWLKNKKPVDRAGTSILIYYVTPEEAATLNK
ncbi:MAG: glycosyltransferase family 39 protein [Parcubacteria group bacterium]|jgi:4-amino-4-deoxy-L-arabinose transferase-like glycosyltransferase